MPAMESPGPMTRRRAASMKGGSTQEMKWGFMPGLDDTMQMNLTDKGAQRRRGCPAPAALAPPPALASAAPSRWVPLPEGRPAPPQA